MFKREEPLIECVPNFSEGRNPEIIQAIANSISSSIDVKLMHIDIGYDANRTVFTFAGKPDAVIEAAYQAVLTAQNLIDMRTHKGAHPRMGACDVCPLIPLQQISMEEVVTYSKLLGEQLGNAGIPVYLYENSATQPLRKNLSYLRKGEYESIQSKLTHEEWKPDYGPVSFNETFGIMALGARKFLLAYNINLNSKDEEMAKKIAKQIRTIRNSNDGSYYNTLFQHVKAIGWYMDEYKCCQISTNITDFELSPIIEVFDAIEKIAHENNIQVNGSELIGLIPMQALKHPTLTVEEVIHHLGLSSIRPFNSQERIIEYNLGIV